MLLSDKPMKFIRQKICDVCDRVQTNLVHTESIEHHTSLLIDAVILGYIRVESTDYEDIIYSMHVDCCIFCKDTK